MKPREWRGYFVTVNDLLVEYPEIVKALSFKGVPIDDTFGSSSENPRRPTALTVSWTSTCEPERVRDVLIALNQVNVDFIECFDDSEARCEIYIGSLEDEEEPWPGSTVEATDGLLEAIRDASGETVHLLARYGLVRDSDARFIARAGLGPRLDVRDVFHPPHWDFWLIPRRWWGHMVWVDRRIVWADKLYKEMIESEVPVVSSGLGAPQLRRVIAQVHVAWTLDFPVELFQSVLRVLGPSRIDTVGYGELSNKKMLSIDVDSQADERASMTPELWKELMRPGLDCAQSLELIASG